MVQSQILDLIKDGLTESPRTAKDASTVYESVSAQLAMYFASMLPSVEAKLFLAAKLATKEVEEVCISSTCCCKFAPIK